MKYIDSEKLIAEIERRMENYNASIEKYYNNQKSIKAERDSWKWAECKWFLKFITSLQQEQKCIFGNIPSEDICSFCSAYCSLRVPKTKVSTSTEIATTSGQVENLTFEEYLRGVFEINNGIENDPDNLVRIHAPELLKLARKQEQPEANLEKEANECWDYVFSAIGWDENSLMTMNHKEFLAFARHFYELGQSAMRERITNPEYNHMIIENMKFEYPTDESNARKEK